MRREWHVTLTGFLPPVWEETGENVTCPMKFSMELIKNKCLSIYVVIINLKIVPANT